MLHRPGMTGGRNFLSTGGSRVQMKRQEVSVRVQIVGLIKNRLSVGELQGLRIIKSAYARHGAEVVVERTIFLHQHDDMLYVAQGTGGVGLLRQHALHIWRHQTGSCGTDCQSARAA